MFQINEFFKIYDTSVSNDIKQDITEFIDQIFKELDKFGVEKFTVIMGDVDPVTVTITNDKNRKIKILAEIPTIMGIAIIQQTEISEVAYSGITLIYVKGNAKWQESLSAIPLYFKLPIDHSINTSNGSLYLIVTKNFVGKLWNIHTDSFVTKAHITLTECDEDFVWFPSSTEKVTEKLFVDKLYLFNVRIPHTVYINQYVNNIPRIHIVADIINSYEKRSN